ncbi:Ldh family oxidoreductase [Sulfuracidifex metallicus]|uniref:Ldh family oxidoreductase n=1 Tax=Sulfuracidifex metallicus DSM 6482 = JCM 9184 TaxID=523847 RepID=A0A6A9QTL5_SULME|nr:Ldh family oxidoreductase [Sulfuracidifex metallicus]MUN29113.1 hypothetical protein [Sulfuracidifex metallicus DSM 6482 = JCM 9184]WOE50367.1 Ldh family oxidoreductase [Sulfuracidifex metallicus DSM 6482 = JCM 9184]
MLVTSKELREITYSIFQKLTYQEYAEILADELVESNVMGHDDHGVQLIPYYVRAARGEQIDIGGQKIPPICPKRIPEINRQGFLVRIDGMMTFGQVVLRKSAEQNGDILVFIGRNVSHLGRLSSFTVRMAKKGYVSIMMARSPPLMSLPGMKRRVLGNNPISISFPDCPVYIDTSLSNASWGKIFSSILKGETIEEGLLLDAEGKPTTDPMELLKGGSLTPIGAYKGFNLALAVEMLMSYFSLENDFNPFFAISIKQDLLGKSNFQEILSRIPETDSYRLPGSQGPKDTIEIPESLWNELTKIYDSL